MKFALPFSLALSCFRFRLPKQFTWFGWRRRRSDVAWTTRGTRPNAGDHACQFQSSLFDLLVAPPRQPDEMLIERNIALCERGSLVSEANHGWIRHKPNDESQNWQGQ